MFDPDAGIAGIRLAREKQVNTRVIPTTVAIEESIDLAHEIYNRDVPQGAEEAAVVNCSRGNLSLGAFPAVLEHGSVVRAHIGVGVGAGVAGQAGYQGVRAGLQPRRVRTRLVY